MRYMSYTAHKLICCCSALLLCAAVLPAAAEYNPEFMAAAGQEAESILTSHDGAPFGAVIVKDGQIVGRGHDSKHLLIDPTAHAEITAIRDAARNLQTPDLTGCEIYSSAYPCPMCLSAIIWSNIKTVYYGSSVEDSAAAGFGGDDFIYKFINDGMKDPTVLHVEQRGRELSQPAFDKYVVAADEFVDYPEVNKKGK